MLNDAHARIVESKRKKEHSVYFLSYTLASFNLIECKGNQFDGPFYVHLNCSVISIIDISWVSDVSWGLYSYFIFVDAVAIRLMTCYVSKSGLPYLY
jgi:hypothetical protein